MLSDFQLIKLVKDGQTDAFKSLITKYKDKVFTVAYSYTSDYAESDDITQIVFLKVYTNLSKFEERAAFSTWLYRIAVNECFNSLKKRKKNTFSLESTIASKDDLYLKDMLADSSLDIENNLAKKEEFSKVRKALLELPKKYRMIVTLRDIEDLSYDEISKILKISDAKVKVWLFRARNKLKKILNKE